MTLPIVHCLPRRWLFLTAAVLALSCVTPQLAQAQKNRLKQIDESAESEINSSGKEFCSLYARDYPIRKERYFSNRKIVWIERTFNPLPATEMGFTEPLQQCRVEYLANDKQARLEMILSNDQVFDEHPQIAKIITASNLLHLSWNAEKERYVRRTEFQAKYLTDSALKSQTGMPFPMKINDYVVLLEDLNPYFQNGLNEAATVDAVAMEPCLWNGKTLMRVTFRTAMNLQIADPQTPVRTHYGYFDPNNAWICHGMEAEPLAIDCVPRIKRYVNRFEYEDGAEGYPRPSRFIKTAEYHDGSIILVFDITFQSFERAYPEDNDVSLESLGVSQAELNTEDRSQKLAGIPDLKQGYWMWLIPPGILLTVIGAMIGKLASKSIQQEKSDREPVPEY